MRLSSLIFALSLMPACASAPAPASPVKAVPAASASAGTTTAPAPPSNADMLARETAAGALREHDVASAHSLHRGRVLATAAPTVSVSAEGATEIAIPIGADSPMKCWIRPDAPFAGTVISDTFKGLRAKFSKVAFDKLDVRVEGKVPVVAVELLYLTTAQGTAQPGAVMIKLAVFARADDTVICSHEEPGYRATFAKVASSVASSVVQPSAVHPPVRVHTIQIATVNGDRVGFAEEFILGTSAVAERSMGRSTIFAAPSQDALVSEDSRTVTHFDPKGEITKLYGLRLQGLEVATDLLLSRTGNLRYHVEGKVDGKVTALDLTSTMPLLGPPAASERLRSAFGVPHPKKELVRAMFAGGTNPPSMILETVKPTGRPHEYEVFVGGAPVRTILLDDNFLNEGVTLSFPTTQMIFRRALFDAAP